MDTNKHRRLVRLYGALEAVTKAKVDDGLDEVSRIRAKVDECVPGKLRRELDDLVPAEGARWNRATVALLKGWIAGVLHEVEAESRAGEVEVDAETMMAMLAGRLGGQAAPAADESGEDARRHIGYV